MSNVNINGNITNSLSITGSVQSNNTLAGTLSSSGNLSGNIMATVLKGLSAYEVAVENGYTGTEEEWLLTLVGNGIESVELDNNGYLTLYFTDETSYTTPISLKGVDGHSPYIGDNGNWFVYDGEQDDYIDSGFSSAISVGEGLVRDDETGEISVDFTDQATEGNSQLITSGGVYDIVNGLDYETLTKKPQIESVELKGNKTFSDLGINPIEADDLLEILV